MITTDHKSKTNFPSVVIQPSGWPTNGCHVYSKKLSEEPQPFRSIWLPYEQLVQNNTICSLFRGVAVVCRNRSNLCVGQDDNRPVLTLGLT